MKINLFVIIVKIFFVNKLQKKLFFFIKFKIQIIDINDKKNISNKILNNEKY
jgi:hypothetical protein